MNWTSFLNENIQIELYRIERNGLTWPQTHHVAHSSNKIFMCKVKLHITVLVVSSSFSFFISLLTFSTSLLRCLRFQLWWSFFCCETIFIVIFWMKTVKRKHLISISEWGQCFQMIHWKDLFFVAFNLHRLRWLVNSIERPSRSVYILLAQDIWLWFVISQIFFVVFAYKFSMKFVVFPIFFFILKNISPFLIISSCSKKRKQIDIFWWFSRAVGVGRVKR